MARTLTRRKRKEQDIQQTKDTGYSVQDIVEVGGSEDLGAIRAWAKSNGYQIGDRGRIKAEIKAAYYKATSEDQEAAPEFRALAKAVVAESAKITATVLEANSRTPRPERLPKGWDLAADEDTLLDLVYGRKILWKNDLAGTYEEARVLPKEWFDKGVEKAQNHIRIDENYLGRRILHFASADSGFRAVGLDQIVQVNR